LTPSGHSSRPLGVDERLLEESAEDLYEHAPCGYVSTNPEGLIVKINETFLSWTGYTREELIGQRRFQELLSPGGRIYHETHFAPLLRLQGSVREIAVDIKRADRSLLSALINAVVRYDEQGEPQVIRTTVFDATDRRLYEQQLLEARREEQKIAGELQRSLLSGALPVDSRIELAIEYRSAARGLDVGGDWYDAFWVNGSDTIALAVGDVVGRGIAAAATMGQLRSAVRALAATGLRPGALLDALDRFSRRHDVGMNTTLVYAEADLRAERVRWACAGHPPPLLVRAGADPEYLAGGRSAPIDAYVGDAPERADADCNFKPGDTLLIYTDGLVERRDSTIDAGLERLVHEVRSRRDEPVAALATGTFRALYDAVHPDDTCLVALRFR
jgi:PAS domain S-box-containing protein